MGTRWSPLDARWRPLEAETAEAERETREEEPEAAEAAEEEEEHPVALKERAEGADEEEDNAAARGSCGQMMGKFKSGGAVRTKLEGECPNRGEIVTKSGEMVAFVSRWYKAGWIVG
eukprot:945963-Prorocentrum_minimum.AAC.1